MDGGPQYRLLTRTLRPARICAAIPSGSGWQFRALRLLEGLSVTWGGSHDLVVALNADGSIAPELWRLVELFDADEWARFLTTPRHLELIGEDVFERWLEPHAQSLVDQGSLDLEGAKRSLREFVMNDPLDGWQLPDALASDITRCTGVATEFGGSPPVHSYMADQPPEAINVLNLQPLPPRVRLPAVEHLSVEIQLIAAMKWGALSPSAKRLLDDAGCPIVSERVEVGNLDRLLTAAWFGPARWWVRSDPGPSGEAPSAMFDDDLFFTETPFALSSVGCVQLHRSDHRFDQHQTIVVGSDNRDFCYALALSRIGVPALWLPAGLLDDDEYGPSALRALVGGLRGSRLGLNLRTSDRRIQFCSLSLPRDDVEAIAQRVANALRTPLAGTVEVVDHVVLPNHRVPLLGDPQHYDDRLEEPFDGDTMVRRLPPVLPSGVRSADPWKLQWWVEVEQPETPLPGRSRLNQAVVVPDGAIGPSARCGSSQVSYPSHSMGFVVGGSSLAQMAARPRLRFPNASSVFQELFTAEGFECSESSAGRFRRLATEMWGGLDAFSADLGAADRFAILSAWLAEDDKKAVGPRPPGIQLRARRYLSFEEILRVGQFDDAGAARELVDSYLERGIVRRGYVLKCRSCMHTEWYALDDVGHDFKCERCRALSLVTRTSWATDTSEPTPYYDLAEVVFQALKVNCHVPIGALAMLKKTSRIFAEAPELEVRLDADTMVELDLLVIADGKIGLGEAKKGTKLDATAKGENQWLRNLRQLCHVVHADFVVFATASDDWATTTKERITSAFTPGSSPEVRYLSNCAASR